MPPQFRVLKVCLLGALVAALAAGTTGILPALALASEATAVHPHPHRHVAAHDANSLEMGQAMAKMMADMHAPGYSGDADIDFLAMMVPHHQGAIDMARWVLRHGRDPATRALAEEIIAAQQVEIEAMNARLAMLRGADGDTGYPSLSGHRGEVRDPR